MLQVPPLSTSLRHRFATAAAAASQSVASFASIASASSYLPNPFLRIDSLQDPLALPCTTAQIFDLLSVAEPEHAQPFTFFIPSHHVHFYHPRWNVGLANLVVDIRTHLAIPTPFVAHFHGLYVQSVDAHIPLNTLYRPDSPHVFGALIVTLPSLHEGGDFLVRHNEIQLVLESASGDGLYDMQYAAFYLDCDHEMKSITSGYRVTLLYHLQLANASLAIPVIPSHAPSVHTFRSIAHDWQSMSLSHPSTMSRLCCLLHSSYTDISSWNNLYGPDAALFNILRIADCFDLFLVSLRTRKTNNNILERFPYGYSICVQDFLPMPALNTPSLIEISVSPEDFAQTNHISQNSDKMIFGDQIVASTVSDDLWYSSTAIVLWPKPMFISAVSCNVATSLIASAVDREDETSLYGCKDANEFLSRYLLRSDNSMIPYDSILSYFLKENVSVEPVRILLKQIQFTSFTLNLFFPIFQALVDRHSFSALKESICSMLTSQNNSNDEAVVAACWKLLREMQDYSCVQSREEHQVLESITESLIPLLANSVVETTPFRASLLHQSHDLSTFESLTSMPTLTVVSVVSCLYNLGRDDLLSRGVRNIVANKERFVPCIHTCNALSKLLSMSYGIGVNQHTMELAKSVFDGLRNDKMTDRQHCDLSLIFTALLPFSICKDAVMQVMKQPCVYSPLGRVFPAIIKLWRTSADKVKKDFELYAGVMIRCVRDATTDESEEAKQETIVNGLEVLTVMDSLCDSDIQSETSYQLQFAKAITSRGEIFQPRSVARSILLALERRKLNIEKDASVQLMTYSLSSMYEGMDEDMVSKKDWKVRVPTSLTCRCAPCVRVVDFLQDHSADKVTVHGAHMLPNGLTAVALQMESMMPGAEFRVVSYPKATRGKLQIIKNSQGRMPVNEVAERMKIRSENEDLATKLEALLSFIAPGVKVNSKRAKKPTTLEVIEL